MGDCGASWCAKTIGPLFAPFSKKLHHTQLYFFSVDAAVKGAMEGKDGTKYVMKNNAIWKQITEKETFEPEVLSY